MNIGESIETEIIRNKTKICQFLKVSPMQWEKRMKHLHNISGLENIAEKDLTFIMACAYAIKGKEGCNSLLERLCDHQIPEDSENELNPIWFEYSPYICKDPNSGRGGKAKITLDLAFGNFSHRKETESEIAYRPPENGKGWICFVEMKLLEDISGDSTDNPTYNQLAKYIKSAFNFHEYSEVREKKYPENIHVTLVTPKKFMDNPHSRLYGYKFEDYKNGMTINVSSIKIDVPNIAENEYFDDRLCVNLWTESKIDDRLKNLNLHWIPYEKLLDNIPDTNPFKELINKIRAENTIFEKASGV